jgi:hypothetical protein
LLGMLRIYCPSWRENPVHRPGKLAKAPQCPPAHDEPGNRLQLAEKDDVDEHCILRRYELFDRLNLFICK